MEDKFVILSIRDKESKDVANALSNDKARLILETLTEQTHSPTQLSKKLNLPLSTIQYNLDLLTKSRMIKINKTRWSVKGRRIKYYEPAKKFIIIAPEKKEKDDVLKMLGLVPAMLAIVAAAGYAFETITVQVRAQQLVSASSELAKTGEYSTSAIEPVMVAMQTGVPWFAWVFLAALISAIIFLIYAIHMYKK